jgi:multidrug efflux pump
MNQKNTTDRSFWLSELSLSRPASVFILMVLVFVIGFNSYQTLPREAAPEVQIPFLIVNVPYPGSAPEDVESLIVHKMETEMQNLKGLKRMSSTSAEGAAMLSLEFHLGTDINEAKTEVREALDRVRPKLPDDAEDPIIAEINTADFPIMTLNLSGKIGLYRLKNIAEELKEAIEGIPGVLEVTRTGGLEREVQVNVDAEKLRYYNLDLNQVSNAISLENTSIPAGDITIGPLKYMIRVPAEIRSPDEIRHMVITAPGQVPIFIRDVAEVRFGFKEITSRSRYFGVESVSLDITKRPGENLIAITDQIKVIIQQFQRRYAALVTITVLSDHSDYVRQFVRDLENNIYSGLFSVLLVLLVILGIRNALFVAAAIPFSLLITFMVVQAMGVTLNMVVLFGLIMALGMLVDNAIVVVENIYRHIEQGATSWEAARKGVGEVAIPIITSTLTTLAAFFPLLFMPGIMGDFMGYMPQTLIITLSASLLVALMITPVLCGSLMRPPRHLKTDDVLEIARRSRILRGYRAILEWALERRIRIVIIVLMVWLLIVLSYFRFVFPQAGVEFFPTAEPDHAVVHIEAPFGTSLATSDQLVQTAETALGAYHSRVTSLVANVGQPRGSMSSGKTTHLSHIAIDFPGWEERTDLPSALIAEIRQLVRFFTGAQYRITKSSVGPPTGKPVNIEISGQDLNELKRISLSIQAIIKDTPGLVNLADNFVAHRSEIQVVIDREKTARLGLNATQVASFLRTAIHGRTVSTYRVDRDEFDIVVRLDVGDRESIASLRKLYLKTPAGVSVPLGEMATITNAPALGSIRHIGQHRAITVSADAEGISGAVLLRQVRQKLADFQLPPNYRIIYTGENESQQEMEDFLPKGFMVAVFLIFLILVTQFNSLALPFIIVTSVFLSFMGIFLGMTIHGSPISIIMGGIGAISLAGVVVNNAIVLIDYIQQLRQRGLSRHQATLLGGMLRLRPVLLTAVTTILALIPVTIGLDIDFARDTIFVLGSESGQMWFPMALSVIYGLGVATVLTLIVVPVLYSLIESGRDGLADLFGRQRTAASDIE